MNLLRTSSLITALWLGIPASGICDELSERAAITKDVVGLFGQQDFAALETQANSYRSSQARTSSGVWKLTVFYAGIATVFDIKRKEDSFWTAQENSAKSWGSLFPNSATARLVYAHLLIQRGWSYRGEGYANTVEPQNWQPFRQYTNDARGYLEKHKAIASKDPRWYELMAIIAKAQSWPEQEFSKLIEEGLARYPSFYQLYFAAIEYYSPKWGGSATAIESFAKDALKRTQATEGSGMYARIYWYASQTQYDERLFSESLVDWPVMKKGMDDVLKKYPDAWNINNFAKFACLSRDKDKTAQLIRRIDGAPLLAAWRTMATLQRCSAWALS